MGITKDETIKKLQEEILHLTAENKKLKEFIQSIMEFAKAI